MVDVITAYVAQPNTPEADAQPRVWHVVRGLRNGRPVQQTILAAAPDEAITQARLRPDESWAEVKENA